MGSSFNTNDYFVPAAPGFVLSGYYSYAKYNYYNDSGKKSDQIILSQDPPFVIDIEQNVSTHSIIPMPLYFGKGKILNANWGVMFLPIINNPNANIVLDFYTGQEGVANEEVSINSFGLGDFYLQPVWLTWDNNKTSFTFSYGFWMPTGKYEANDTENVGMGYWSHNFRVAGRYKIRPNINASVASTYETNSKQEGVDYTEGDHFTVDYGGSYSFKMGHEIGFMGHGTWQVTDDEGVKGSELKDRIYGLGIYGSYWFKPGKFGILARALNNFGSRNRFGGPSFQIGLNYIVGSN